MAMLRNPQRHSWSMAAGTALLVAGCGGGGSDAPQAQEPPTINLVLEELGQLAGDPATLNWAAEDAASCQALGDWTGNRDTTGSFTLGPLYKDSEFSLQCRGPGGTATVSVEATRVRIAEATIRDSVIQLDDSYLALIIDESDTALTLGGASPVQSGDVFLLGQTAYKAVSVDSDGDSSVISFEVPTLEEVLSNLRIAGFFDLSEADAGSTLSMELPGRERGLAMPAKSEAIVQAQAAEVLISYSHEDGVVVSAKLNLDTSNSVIDIDYSLGRGLEKFLVRLDAKLLLTEGSLSISRDTNLSLQSSIIGTLRIPNIVPLVDLVIPIWMAPELSADLALRNGFTAEVDVGAEISRPSANSAYSTSSTLRLVSYDIGDFVSEFSGDVRPGEVGSVRASLLVRSAVSLEVARQALLPGLLIDAGPSLTAVVSYDPGTTPNYCIQLQAPELVVRAQGYLPDRSRLRQQDRILEGLFGLAIERSFSAGGPPLWDYGVCRAPVDISLAAPEERIMGEPLEVRATVVTANIAAANVVPTGTVVMEIQGDNDLSQCTAQLEDGEGFCELLLTSGGERIVRGTYSGDDRFAPAIVELPIDIAANCGVLDSYPIGTWRTDLVFANGSRCFQCIDEINVTGLASAEGDGLNWTISPIVPGQTFAYSTTANDYSSVGEGQVSADGCTIDITSTSDSNGLSVTGTWTYEAIN